MPMLCGTCFFMDATGDRTFCRRYPAQLVNQQVGPGQITLQALYPVVDPEKDWCGEHSVVDSAEPEELN